MPPASDRPPVRLLFEPEFLPLARAYGYLRLAGVAPRPAAAAVSRLQALLAGAPGTAPGDWRCQLLDDPAWAERRVVTLCPPPPLSGRRSQARNDSHS